MSDSNKKQTALVTGASSGIGLEYCRRLAERNINLIMISNQESELLKYAIEISQKYNVKVTTYCIDLSVEGAARSIMQFIDKNSLDVDILINNAGIFSFNPVLDTPITRLNLFIDLHMRAVTELCYFIGDRMKIRKSGYILNMSSMSCWMPMPGIAMYSATKAYIRVLSRSLHYELKDYGVAVMVACPGGIATDLFGLPRKLQRFAVNIGVLDTPRSFTNKAIKKLFRKKQQYINGWLNKFSIFFVGIMPTQVRMMVKHKLLDKNIRKR